MTVLMFLQDNGDRFIQTELGFVLLLSIAAAVAVLVRRVGRFPYTVALVLAGLLLSLFPDFIGVPISSELILAILVPPLVFEASLHIRWKQLRRDLLPILLLAVVGVALSTFIVAEIVMVALEEDAIPFSAAVAFGALISATDPVAVVAFFRSLGVSKRLSLLLEGESLLNDGVAIVIFGLAAGFIESVSPEFAGSGFDAALSIFLTFLEVAVGGLAIGVFLGYVVSQIVLRHVDDPLVETATTVAVSFGAYVAAEEFHLSGILAVVAAGVFVGNIGAQNTSPSTQVTLDNFWEFMAFVANSLVFLFIGLRIELRQFRPNLFPILVAVLAVLLSRAAVIYTMGWLNNRLNAKNSIPLAYRHVMFWGGLRGAISLALALTLHEFFAPRVALELQLMTFGVVLFTLLVQGTTISPLLKRLELSRRSGRIVVQQRYQGQLFASQAGKRELDRLYEEGILSANVWEAMAQVYDLEIDERNRSLRDHLLDHPELELEMVLQARDDTLRAERSAIAEVFRRGLISEEVYYALLRETDNRTAALNLIMSRRSATATDPGGDD
ncbi:MAG TPA: Na+/H+ antiporter [Candidatus Binatia bacterium]|jgi:CPA1 family monovalent cation:H+ antiporter|nr:Na+/H+ antiporter [Candidatus Binatia bacterium]